MLYRGITTGKLAAALGAAALLLVPAIASAKPDSKKRPPAVSISFDRISSFTPATADPRLAAEIAIRGQSATNFKFTPAAPKGRPSQVRVAIRAGAGGQLSARAAEMAAAPAMGALAPTSYNLGVSVGWRRFAVTGDVAKSGSLTLGERESAMVGVNYSLNRRLTGRVAASAERSEGARTPIGRDEGYAVDVGGAYSLTRNIAVTGGVRYRIDRDRALPLEDQRSDSQAVYIGTAFKF